MNKTIPLSGMLKLITVISGSLRLFNIGKSRIQEIKEMNDISFVKP